MCAYSYVSLVLVIIGMKTVALFHSLHFLCNDQTHSVRGIEAPITVMMCYHGLVVN